MTSAGSSGTPLPRRLGIKPDSRVLVVAGPAGALDPAPRASGVGTDLDENVVRDHGLGCGLVDVKVAAIDAAWSGLKFVRRLRDR